METRPGREKVPEGYPSARRPGADPKTEPVRPSTHCAGKAHPVGMRLRARTFAANFWANSSGKRRLSRARCDVPGNRATKDVCWEKLTEDHRQAI